MDRVEVDEIYILERNVNNEKHAERSIVSVLDEQTKKGQVQVIILHVISRGERAPHYVTGIFADCINVSVSELTKVKHADVQSLGEAIRSQSYDDALHGRPL